MKADSFFKRYGDFLSIATLFILSLFFWSSFLLYPIRLWVVMLHELSHGIGALLTGGSIVRIAIAPDESGVCYTMGGWPGVIIPAGYLGSMLWGSAILLISSRTRYDRHLSGALGVLWIFVTALWVRNIFGIVLGLSTAIIFGVLSRWGNSRINDGVLRFIGLASIFYAIIDIKDDLIVRTVPGSDAWAMSQQFFLPPVFWGVFWVVIAILIGYKVIQISLKSTE